MKRDQGGCDTKGHHVGQAVVFGAEIALGARHARHPAVRRIKDDRGQYGERGGSETAAHAGNCGVETGEQRTGRDDVRQQEDAAAAGCCGTELGG